MDKAKAKIYIAVAIFGTTGFFLRYLAVPVATVEFICCLLGMVTVMVMMKLTKRKLRWRYIKKSLPLTFLSGGALGGSWIFFLLAQKSSDNAIASVYYYFAPLALALLSPLLGEKYRKKKLLLCALALGGLVLTTVFWEKGFVWDFRFLLALLAGALFAVVVVCNKNLVDISSYDKTLLQLAAAAAVLLPYCLFTGGFSAMGGMSATGFVALMILGVVHTGIACRMYFDGIMCLPLQNTAIYSYVNPAVAIFLSAFMLKQKMVAGEVFGVVLILAAIMVSELNKEILSRLFNKKG